MVFQLMSKTRQKRTNIPDLFPRQETLGKTTLFKLSQKQPKILNKAGHYNSFFFCPSILRHNEGVNDPNVFLLYASFLYSQLQITTNKHQVVVLKTS